MELMCAYAAVCGADTQLCARLLAAPTTDAGLALLEQADLREPVLNRMLSAVQEHLQRRTGAGCQIGAVLFSNQYGLLGETGPAKEICEQWRR